jgi:hypothetical protein
MSNNLTAVTSSALTEYDQRHGARTTHDARRYLRFAELRQP